MRRALMIAAWCAIAVTAAGDAHARKDENKETAETPADPMVEARRQVKALYDAVWRVERLLQVAGNRAVRSSCVEERLAEAKAHLRLGTEELTRIEQSVAREHTSGVRVKMADERDTRAYALMRLGLLIQRSGEVERAAGVCVADDDGSAIDVKQMRVEIGPPTPVRSPARADPEQAADQERDRGGRAADQQHPQPAP